jgi:G3E family GTPase
MPASAASTGRARVPVTIVTGFLGAGKTTLLNRILREPHGLRIAVIENEFGEEGVDNDLLVDSGEAQIVEMNNGCICCTVRGDLIRILGQLREQRSSGALAFDRVVIETTGLADPAPVAQTFFIDESVADYYCLDGIVTVVDAMHGADQLAMHHEAQEQVGFADRILVSKPDLVTAGQREALTAQLSRMNPRAPVRTAHFGEAPVRELLEIRGFDLNDILEIDPNFLGEETHEHDPSIESLVFRADAPFDQDRLQAFFATLLAQHGPALMRYKGVLHVDGLSGRLILQGVHMLMSSDLGRAWGETEPRRSKLVFIGRHLPRETILSGLSACVGVAV